MHLCWTMACWGFFILVCILFLDSPSTFSLFFSVVWECLLAKAAASRRWGEWSLKALAHIHMPDFCQYLFPSWFGSKSNTCYGGRGCCDHSRCCGWSIVAGCKCTVPPCQCLGVWVWSCQMKNSVYWIVPMVILSRFGNVGFGLCPKSDFYPPPNLPFFSPCFHDWANTLWRGTRIINREHWLVKLFPADASFIWRAGNSLACFSPQSAKELVRYDRPQETECVRICQRVPHTAEPHSRCWLWSLLCWEQNWSITLASCWPQLGLCPQTLSWGVSMEPASPSQSEVCLLVLVPSGIPPAQVLMPSVVGSMQVTPALGSLPE